MSCKYIDSSENGKNHQLRGQVTPQLLSASCSYPIPKFVHRALAPSLQLLPFTTSVSVLLRIYYFISSIVELKHH